MTQRRKAPFVYIGEHSTTGIWVDSYAEVKKNMKKFLTEATDNKVQVYRRRRGEFGEWYEHWQFNAERKPVIVKQGWM